jgi:hypothetical protein
LERRGRVLLMGLNRPQKRNAFNIELLMELGRAYELLERDDDLRCGVLFGHGDHFTGAWISPRSGPRSPKATVSISRCGGTTRGRVQMPRRGS